MVQLEGKLSHFIISVSLTRNVSVMLLKFDTAIKPSQPSSLLRPFFGLLPRLRDFKKNVCVGYRQPTTTELFQKKTNLLFSFNLIVPSNRFLTTS